MSSSAHITIHPSQFPEAVAEALHRWLSLGQTNTKFHYDSLRQTEKWLAVHRAYSPSRTDADCAAIYDRSFAAVAAAAAAGEIHLIGLGCGGGQKDTRLLRLLSQPGRVVHYSPTDVSVAMVLVAREAALSVIPEALCHPLVCDLAMAPELRAFFDAQPCAPAARIYTFFGMIPNFEPRFILSRLGLVQATDQLLFSANLSPGTDYEAGIRRILPLYDNPLTRDWLMTFLYDLGVEDADGELRFAVEDDASAPGIKRIAANFHFQRPRSITVADKSYSFPPGFCFRLFYSYRYTPRQVISLLSEYDFEVRDQWIAGSGEEGVFWCERKRR